MPLMYTGKLRGYVEHDEIHTTDHGKNGVTTVGIIYPKTHDPAEAKKNRDNLISVARSVIEDLILKEEKEEAEAVARKVEKAVSKAV